MHIAPQPDATAGPPAAPRPSAPLPVRFDVFLSHHNEDKPTVERIARALRERGLVPWLDAWALTPGGDWP